MTYSLKKPKEKSSPIWATLSDGRSVNIKLYPGFKVRTKHWSKRDRIVLSADPNSASINSYLKDYKVRVLEIYLNAKSCNVKVDGSFIREQLNPEEDNGPKGFWETWHLFISTNKDINWQKATYLKYQTLEKHLLKFEGHSRFKLKLDTIDETTLEMLQVYYYKNLECNTESTSKYIGLFKTYLNWCVRRKYTSNSDFKNFKVIRQPESLKVIVTDEELQKMKKYDCSEKKYLENVRQLFILSCRTGLRFSDYSRISKEHLKMDSEGQPFIQIRQGKTNDMVELPLVPEAEAIIRSMFEGEVHAISNQKMNEYLKELCKLAEVNEMFEVHSYKGKVKTVSLKPKHELVSTHTGRRTFATDLLQKGISAQTVMRYTGHKDYKSFAKYVNIPKQAEMDVIRAALQTDLSIMKVS